MAFELTVTTRGKKKIETALLDDSMKTSAQFAAVVKGVNARHVPSLKDLLVLPFTQGGKISNT